uniref:Uncharacterized protein n=1 Tax=Tanacetum cinerariifolium TaxID=118510 RepID=A0A6L2MN54_TANCI|nr:hypothetical protein [Tanacetum cinerariifolium]
MEITATIDGKVKVVTEASVRRHLKSKDSEDPSIPYDSPLLRVNTLGSDECTMTQQELTILCTTLLQKVESLEADLKQTKQVYGAAYTKLIMKVKKLEKTVKTGKARRKAQIVVFDDEEKFEDPSKQERNQPENQLGVLSAAKVLADTTRRNVQTYTRRRAVSTGSGGVSTASRMISTAKESVSTVGASMPVSTTGMIDKGKGIMEESKSNVIKTKRKQEQERLGLEIAVRLQEQFDKEERQRIARVYEAVQTFTNEEWENIRERVEANEELTQRLQAEERDKYSEVDQANMLELFEATMRSINDFVLMKNEDDKAVPKLAKSRSSKRDAEEELDQGRSKKQKIGKSSEPRNKDVDELSLKSYNS